MSERGTGTKHGQLALVVGVALLLYLPSIDGEFLNWDDEWLIVESRHHDEFSDLGRILDPTAYRTSLGAEYLPVRDLSFWVDRHLWGLNPLGFHVTNALLYALVCGLALFVLRDLTGSTRAAIVGALLFAAHPVHVESVAWISERKGLFAAAFLFASYLAYRRSSAGVHRGWLAASVGLFLLAALSKSTVHFLAPLLPCLEWIEARREKRSFAWRRSLALALPFLAISVGAIALNAIHQTRAGGVYGWEGTPFVDAVLLVASVAARQAGHLVLPLGLSAEYDTSTGPVAWVAVAGVVVVLGAAVVAVVRGHRSAACVAYTALAWAPVSNLLALPNPMADRYMFLPSLGAMGLAGLLFASFLERRSRARTIARVVVGLLVATFAVLTVLRAEVWTDRMLLWKDAVARAPGSARALLNLGEVHLARDEVDAAFACFDRMLEVEPDEADWYPTVAARYLAAGDPVTSERILRRGLERLPDHPAPRIALALEFLKRPARPAHRARELAEAERLLRDVLDMPHASDRLRAIARATLGGLECSRGRLELGVALIRQALRAGLPKRDELLARRNLVKALRDLGRVAEAEQEARLARKLADWMGP